MPSRVIRGVRGPSTCSRTVAVLSSLAAEDPLGLVIAAVCCGRDVTVGCCRVEIQINNHTSSRFASVTRGIPGVSVPTQGEQVRGGVRSGGWRSGRVDRWTWHGRACCCFRGQIRRKSSRIGENLNYSPISSFEQKPPSRRSVRGSNSKCKEKVGPIRLSRDGSGHVSDMGHARDTGLWEEVTRDGKTVAWELGELGWVHRNGKRGNTARAVGKRACSRGLVSHVTTSAIDHQPPLYKLSRWGTRPRADRGTCRRDWGLLFRVNDHHQSDAVHKCHDALTSPFTTLTSNNQQAT